VQRRRSTAAQRRLDVLVQVNTSGEASKSGVAVPSALLTLADDDDVDVHGDDASAAGDAIEEAAAAVAATEEEGGGGKDEPLVALVRHIVDECPALRFRGLMTIGAFTGEGAGAAHSFRTLRACRAYVAHCVPKAAAAAAEKKKKKMRLSMGMSHDFEQAIAAGATSVRVGSALFGARPAKATAAAAAAPGEQQQQQPVDRAH
jgi:uncharacterized pyridoxal phosphate-containing UPF0001 family protein